MKWPPKQVLLLRDLWKQDVSAADIAKVMQDKGWHTTRSAVIGKAHREGLPIHSAYRNRKQVRKAVPKDYIRIADRIIEDIPEGEGKYTLAEARDNHCRYFIGKKVCGCQVARFGSSWCGFHEQRVYAPSQKKVKVTNKEKHGEVIEN